MHKNYLFLRNVAAAVACLAAIGVTSVKAQNAKFTQTPVTYFEEYDKGSGKLISKQWRSGNNLRSESVNGETVVRRNFKTTPQPAELFEIKKEWKGQTLPADGLMEMLGGKSRSENQKEADKKQQEITDILENVNKTKDDSKGKSDAEKLQEALKMLGGSQKKQQ